MLRSLYARVLVGFLAILALTLAAFAGTTAALLSRADGPEEFFRGTIGFHLASAELALADGGPPALARYLARLDDAYRCRAYLLDAAGRDVLDGTDRAALAAAAAEFPSPGGAVGRASADGRFRLVVVRPPTGVLGIALHFLWIPVAVVVACLLFAYSLVRPVRRLRDAVRRFGRGDLTARTGLRRTDEIGQLADEFDGMAARIERLVTAERQLLQDVSHELRSPLARLAFALETADPARAVERARREYRRLTDLVGELVELARAEGEGAVAGPVAVGDVLADVLHDVTIEADARGCRFELSCPDGLFVRADARLLRRAVENVVRNAVRFSPPGGIIAVGGAPDGPWVRVVVRDAGPGVPADELDAIFAPFHRVEQDRPRDGDAGVGLGLAIARRVAALHHGTIAARNADPGLEVELRLPAV